MIQPENINKTIKKTNILFFPEARFMTRQLEAFRTATIQRKEAFHLKGSAHIICGVSTYFWPVLRSFVISVQEAAIQVSDRGIKAADRKFLWFFKV